MKKALYTILISMLSLLFYFLLSTNTADNNSAYSYSSQQKKAPEKENLKSVDASVFCFTTRNTITFLVAKNNANTPYKTFSNTVFATHTKTIESLLHTSYLHYTLHSKNELYRLLQSKILFPFHYFW